MIQSISFKNFKCFERQKIKCAGLTLLSGLNGMGKSSVLQSLLLLRQSQQANLLTTAGLVLNGDLVNLGRARDLFYDNATKDLLEIAVTWKANREAIWRFDYDSSADVLAPSNYEVNQEIYHANLFTDHFHYIQAERLGPRTSFPMSDFAVNKHGQIGSRGEYTAHFLESYGEKVIQEGLLLHPSTDSNRVLEQTNAWLSEISPGVRLHLTMTQSMDLANLEYSFDGVGNRYRSTNVGFGLTYTLPVLAALLASDPGSLILIENPEAHLHPRGQAKLGELIARAAAAGRQIIFETHSDHVLNGIRVAAHRGLILPDDVAIHFFNREEGRTRVMSPRLDRNGRLDQWPEYFFDEWDRQLEILLDPPAES